MIPLKGVLHWTRHKLEALAGSEVLLFNGHCPSYGTAAQSLSNQQNIQLKRISKAGVKGIEVELI